MNTDPKINTYNSINNWGSFRLRLFAEGVLVGIFTGLVVGAFRYAIAFIEQERGGAIAYISAQHSGYIAALVVGFLLLAFLLAQLVKWEPLSGGSGIPQVKGNILGIYQTTWWKIIVGKFLGGVLGIGAGMSLGREGPSVQLGAMCGQGVSRLLRRTPLAERYIISSGAGAGLAAAFNAPLAGVIFTMEELHKSFSSAVLLPTLAATLTSTIVSHLFFGQELVFTIPKLELFPVEYLPFLLLVGLVTGLTGVFFNHGLIQVGSFYTLPIFRNNFSRIALPLLLAIPLSFYLPQVLGGGNGLVDALVQTPFSLQLLLVLLVGKFIYTMLSYGSGVPGGFFLPMLVLGALIGNIYSAGLIELELLPVEFRVHFIVYAMAGFFAASVRSPITGIVLIMEMTGYFRQLVPLALVAMVSYVVAELLHNKPIYEELLERALAKSSVQQHLDQIKRQREIIEVPVESGSPVEGKLISEIAWPGKALLVDVKRGDTELVPRGNTKLLLGDYLYILVEQGSAQAVRDLISGR